MKLEQPGQLNVLLAGVGSHDRRTLFKEIMPILVFCWVCGVAIVAIVAFTNWIEGRPNKSFLGRALVIGIGFAALPLGAAEVIRLVHMRAKRTLELNEDGIRASTDRILLKAPWKAVRQFEIGTVDREELAQVTVTAALGRKEVFRRFSMVLDRTAQLPALIHELCRHRSSANNFGVVELPRPTAFARRGIKGLWPVMIGMFLICLGFPVMAVGILDRDAADRPVSRPPVQVERFVKKHFQSAAELRRAFILAGGITGCIGIAFYVWGWRTMDRLGKLAQADVRSRLERISNDPSCKVIIAAS